MLRPCVINTILIVSLFSVVACNTDTNKSKTQSYSTPRDTVVKNDAINVGARKKHLRKPAVLNRKLDARVLCDMLSWESFDCEKYLMSQSFDLQAGGKKIEYLWREPDFGFPEQVRDSIVFQRTEESGTLRIKILTEDHYNYTDEQRRDMYHYKGDPKDYPDHYNAKNVRPAYGYCRLRLYTDSKQIALTFIDQLESLGCKFEKDVLLDIVHEQLEKSIPNYVRANEIGNTCSCPSSVRKIFNDASIDFTTSFESENPSYRLSFDISNY